MQPKLPTLPSVVPQASAGLFVKATDPGDTGDASTGAFDSRLPTGRVLSQILAALRSAVSIQLSAKGFTTPIYKLKADC
jgi:hypothetical protein